MVDVSFFGTSTWTLYNDIRHLIYIISPAPHSASILVILRTMGHLYTLMVVLCYYLYRLARRTIAASVNVFPASLSVCTPMIETKSTPRYAFTDSDPDKQQV